MHQFQSQNRDQKSGVKTGELNSKPKQAKQSAQSDLPDNPAKAAQPLQNRILSTHWTHNNLGSGNCKYVHIKSGKNVLRKLSISALVNFNFTAVQPNLHCFPLRG